MAHTLSIKVRGYHVDSYAHVNNARYLEFLEEARWSLLDEGELIDTLHQARFGFVVVRIDIRFRAAARVGDLIHIHTTLAELGDRSAVIHQRILFDDPARVIAEADVTFVVVDQATERAIPLTDTIRAALEKLPTA